MNKKICILAGSVALALASLSANAGDVAGMKYVLAPTLEGVWTDQDRNVDDGMQYGIGAGVGLNERWNLESSLFYSQFDGANESRLKMSGISLSALRLFFPESKASPFVSFGVGVMDTNPTGAKGNQDGILQAGLGVMVDLFEKADGSRKFQARPEVKARWSLSGNKGASDPVDGIAGISFVFAWGPAHVAPPAPAPEPVAEPTPPPPPPPPPADTDGDGVIDPVDQCPDTPKGDRVGPQGCSCDVVVRVNFANDSAVLDDTAKKVLDGVIVNLKRLQFIAGTAEGHTDSNASDAYNQKLSERRAKSVADYIEAAGVAQGRLAVSGKGEAEPLADNATAEGRAQNRRVVLKRTDCDAPK